MSNAILVIGILILVAVLFFGYTALAKKYLNEEKEEKEGKPKVKELVSLSKRGSILFYIFLILLFIFFLVMYIMWKLQ
ncbi:MAG: hypothetical protein PHO12_04550 [Bacteroidales bacterium]|nr:hypothetical protein [Bacteroidales bacterium]MDD4684301.1 hypothetical protein [Bacteroidales bacterium]